MTVAEGARRRPWARYTRSMLSADTPTSATSRARVLVVEDDEHIRDLVLLHLKLEGLAATGAVDGTEALRLARSEPFDLVVLDLMLPGLDGVTVCRAIRRDAENTDVPILMLTARREEADKVLGLESGADDYLTKPFGVRGADCARPCAPSPPLGQARALLARGARERRRVDGRPVQTDGPSRRSRHRVDGARVRSALRARRQPRDRVQPRSARSAGLGSRHAHHDAKRRHAGQAIAKEDRGRWGRSADDPDGLGRRVQSSWMRSRSSFQLPVSSVQFVAGT